MYSKLNMIYNRERLDVFCMATTHLLNIGFDYASQLSDEECEATDGNGIMTKEFCIYLNKLAREIAQACDSPIELIQLCQAENVYDTRYCANKLNRKELEMIAVNAVNAMICDDFYPDEDYNLAMQIADYIGCEQEDLIMLEVFDEDDFEFDNDDDEEEE